MNVNKDNGEGNGGWCECGKNDDTVSYDGYSVSDDVGVLGMLIVMLVVMGDMAVMLVEGGGYGGAGCKDFIVIILN